MVVVVLSALSMVAQTPPAHTYFDTPLIIEDGADIIDSTDHALPDTVPAMFLNGNEAGNWYRLVGDEDEYTYLSTETISSNGPWTTRSAELRGSEIIGTDGWSFRSIVKLTPGVVIQYYIGRFLSRGHIKYRVKRRDYQPNNPVDEISSAGCFELNECINVSTFVATPSAGSQGFVQFADEADVFYKFTTTSEDVFHTTSLQYPRYEIFTDLSQSNFEKVSWEQNALGYKYSLEIGSTYYIRFTNYDPFDESIEQFCLDVYDPEIHDEEDNFVCDDARSITFSGSGALMFVDTFASSASVIEDCSDPQVSMGQWYHLEERDTTINYTIYTDTNVVKIHAFSGECGALTCFDNFFIDNSFGFYSIKFTVSQGKELYFYVENLNQDDLNSSVYLIGIPSGKAEVCEDAIPVVSDTTLSIDFTDAVFNFNSCTHQTEKEKWISILGDGRRVVIYRSTLSNLHVYDGECDSLECLMISRGVTDYIQTEVGKEYKVAVSNPVTFFPSQPLILDIEYFDPPINETYENAILIGCGDSISRNFDAVARGVPCLYNTKLWYELGPSDSIYNINLPATHSVSGTIYSENENGIDCEDAIGFRGRFNVAVNEGEKKYLAISPLSTNSSFTPTFELTVSCIESAINNDFEDAQLISCDEPVHVRTNNASSLDHKCGTDYPYDNLWYKIIGSDKIYSVERIDNNHNRFTLYQKSEEGNVECIGWPSVYVPGKDTLYVSGSSPGYQGDTLMFKMNCSSMATNRSSDLSESVVCGASTSLDFFDYQDSLSITSGKVDAWYDIHPSGQVLSIQPSGGSSIEKHIYRKVNGALEEVSYTSITHIELPDTTSEYLVQFVSTNERTTLNFAINCLQAATNGSICTAIDLSCQDTIPKMDGRIVEMDGCDETGIPSGYWYRLNGERRVVLSPSVPGSLGFFTVISKDEMEYDTIEVNYGYTISEYAYFDMDPEKEYFIVVRNTNFQREMVYGCFANEVSNSMNNAVPIERGELCYEGYYLLGDDEESEGNYSPCFDQVVYQNGYWFEYITSPNGILDIEITSDDLYGLELFAEDGNPVKCLLPVTSEYLVSQYSVDRYVEEDLEQSKKYLIKVTNLGIGIRFSVCRKYSCEEDAEEIMAASTINICPGVLTRFSIPSHSTEYSYTLNSEATIDSIASNHMYLQYASGFGVDSTTLLVSNYCEEDFEKPIVIKEAHPSLCILFDCAIPNIYVSDQLLINGDVPSQIKVTDMIEGDFNLQAMDLYLQAGREVILHPGASVSGGAQLEVVIEGCEE